MENKKRKDEKEDESKKKPKLVQKSTAVAPRIDAAKWEKKQKINCFNFIE